MTEQQNFQVLVTAEQAWPAFERAVLEARSEISAGFRIFDLTTPLISDEARAVGDTWADLVEHVVARGVRFRLVLSDFDPVMATSLHELTWRTMRQAAAVAELLGPEAARRFQVIPALHPAQAGLVPWLAFLPNVMSKLKSRLCKLTPERLRRQAVGVPRHQMPDLHPVTHHQKLAVIDREVLYIGGLDLNMRRYDSLDHDRPAYATWSDLQVMVRGREAAEAATHLDTFLEIIACKRLPDACRSIPRTLSQPRKLGFWALSPRTVLNEIEAAHLEGFERARHMIMLETQFLRSSVLTNGLVEAARANPDLTLIVVLPALPEDVAFEDNGGLDARYGMALQHDCLDRLTEAFGHRACITTPVQRRMAARETKGVLAGSPIIHVHNKLMIIDDDFALVGSANMNGRSMKWDTEAALRIPEKERVAAVWDAICDHWWAGDVPDGGRDMRTAMRTWSQAIARNTVCLPENRRGFLVWHDPEKRAEMEQRLPGVTENIV